MLFETPTCTIELSDKQSNIRGINYLLLRLQVLAALFVKHPSSLPATEFHPFFSILHQLQTKHKGITELLCGDLRVSFNIFWIEGGAYTRQDTDTTIHTVCFNVTLTNIYLRNRKHVLCFYRVIETQVEVWESKKCCGNTSHSFFEFSQTFRSVSITR